MKGALAKEAHVGASDGAVTQDRCPNPMPGTERAFAEVLAEVMRVERVSVDSHFFEDLGADSLVMAHFCARVRKRGNLPSVSMKDVYGHPTIRKLAAALADAAPGAAMSSVAVASEPATPAGQREYVVCGARQAVFFVA